MVKKTYESSVESTMVGPLQARAKYGKLYPEILIDNTAERTFKRVLEIYSDKREEFGILDHFIDEFSGLNFLYRAKLFDAEVNSFKIQHPQGVVVNLGCGLDNANERIGDKNLKWFQIDLPESISFREKLITPPPNSENIGKSIFDYSWFEDIEFTKSDEVLILAAGLLNYFQEDKLKEFIKKTASYFKGSMLLFDVPSNLLKQIINKKYKKLGLKGIDHEFGLGNPKKILQWSDRIKTLDSKIFFDDVELNPKWDKRTRNLIKIFRKFKLYKLIKLEFK